MDQFQILKIAIRTFNFFIDKGYHDFSSSSGFTFTFFLTKPVDIEINIIVVVIQAHKRGFVAQPTLAKDLRYKAITTSKVAVKYRLFSIKEHVVV